VTVLFLVFRNYKCRGAVLLKLAALKINKFTTAGVCSTAHIWFYVKSSGEIGNRRVFASAFVSMELASYKVCDKQGFQQISLMYVGFM
jgi:hypothetical protein